VLPPLPATLLPPAPFPLVVAQSSSAEFVAPGVRRGTYRLQTADGPLVVHVVAIDATEPTVRFGAVVASDRMISRGETVSSMARRTGAIAGANADYFDIGNTYQPLNVVVRDGALERTPSKRIVLDVRTDRSIHFENVAFAGSLRFGATTMPLTGVNEWPPQGGATLLTPAYGTVKAAPGVRLAEIVPVDIAHVASRIAGQFRIASIAPSQAHPIVGNELGFGPAALALGVLPAVGDALEIDATTTPALEDIACAVGGGPLLVAGGTSVDDPNAPAPEERERRFPVSGALLRADGALLLVEVDGRAPVLSIGVTRPQFAALALGFGATGAMAFDSGGSAELVARTLGERDASVFGTPSDGEERNVADGLFVYSDAPLGAPSQLVVRPPAIVALPHAAFGVRASIVDAAGHALGDARLAGGAVLRAGASPGIVTVRANGLHADVPVDIVTKLARLDLASDARNPAPNAVVGLRATGYDARGRVVALGDGVRLEADRGTLLRGGAYRTSARDATIVARVAGLRATLAVRVGRHVEPLRSLTARTRVRGASRAPPREPRLRYRLRPSQSNCVCRSISRATNAPHTRTRAGSSYRASRSPLPSISQATCGASAFAPPSSIVLARRAHLRSPRASIGIVSKRAPSRCRAISIRPSRCSRSTRSTPWERHRFAPPGRCAFATPRRSSPGIGSERGGWRFGKNTRRMGLTRVALVALVLLAISQRTAPLAATPLRGVPVLMYHKVDAVVPNEAVGRDLTVEPGAFAAQLGYLRAHRIRTITAGELATAVARGNHPHDAVVLTFDDGYADAATTALPILRRYGARATFYVSSGFVGTPRHLTWKQMRAMRAAGMEVACHGTDHLDLSTLDRAGQLREAGGCMKRFARFLGGAAPTTYAYPAGKYDATTFAIMRELGIRAAFTERPGNVTDLTRRFELPRRRVRHDDGLAQFAAIATP